MPGTISRRSRPLLLIALSAAFAFGCGGKASTTPDGGPDGGGGPCGDGYCDVAGGEHMGTCLADCPDTCPTGFEFDGTSCIVAACQGACDADATFGRVGGTGAPRCACDAGFVGDGFTCAALSCAPTCDANATCTASSDGASAACVCNAGFFGDGVACTAVTATRFVNAATGVDTGDCSAVGGPCLTINYAVGQASTGDAIQVAAGTYPELVVVDKGLTFLGANAGVDAVGSLPSRGAESTVIGFRSPGDPHPTSANNFSVTIDGFTIDPQGDATALSWSTYHLVSLYGGPMVRVVNNVFDGGTWNPNCDDADDPADANPRVLLCKDMADSALMIQWGKFEVSGNSFTDFRRPIDIALFDAAPSVQTIERGLIAGNYMTHVSIRGIWLLDRYQGEVTVLGNDFDASNYDAITIGAAAVVISGGANTLRGNDFRAWGSAVFAQVCDGSNASYASNTYAGNRFVGNRSGIQYFDVATDPACEANAVISGNDFEDHVWYAVRWNGDFSVNDPPTSLDATGNWFGAATGAEALTVYTYDALMDLDANADNVTPFVTVANPYTVSGGCSN